MAGGFEDSALSTLCRCFLAGSQHPLPASGHHIQSRPGSAYTGLVHHSSLQSNHDLKLTVLEVLVEVCLEDVDRQFQLDGGGQAVDADCSEKAMKTGGKVAEQQSWD